TNPSLEKQAKAVMSVGEGFNFEGMDFAKHSPLHLDANIFIPNPLALIYLKMRSYYHNPERKKDFVDIVEVILRLSTESNIFADLRTVIDEYSGKLIHEQIERMCLDIEQDKGGIWDLDDIKESMDERGILGQFEWSEIPDTFLFFREKIFSS
ncbi:MAG: hypothetical protein HQK51_21950, partial [Oligoflexia bacterium]|nr:hypothetical protein [Oligoflexia bacterium]